MKRSLKDCLYVSSISFIFSIAIFLLLNVEILAFNENINTFLLVSMIISIYVLSKLLKINKSDTIYDHYCYCGHLCAIGAAGIFIIPFILMLFVTSSGTFYNLVFTIYFLFLLLFIGGLVCLLYTINNCHEDCYEDCKKNEYKDYVYKDRRR